VVTEKQMNFLNSKSPINFLNELELIWELVFMFLTILKFANCVELLVMFLLIIQKLMIVYQNVPNLECCMKQKITSLNVAIVWD
jgi:hypothetical protein